MSKKTTKKDKPKRAKHSGVVIGLAVVSALSFTVATGATFYAAKLKQEIETLERTEPRSLERQRAHVDIQIQGLERELASLRNYQHHGPDAVLHKEKEMLQKLHRDIDYLRARVDALSKLSK